jgi:class 3 adenylate cyclase
MKFRLNIPFLKRIKSKKKNGKIRRVYFGLRFRLLAMLIMVMIVFLSFVALLLYQHQVSIIAQETRSNSETLTRILAGPAEIYLDRMIDISTAESKLKLDLIEKDARNFITYNNNIEKIVIIDDKGTARYSSLPAEIGTNIKSRGYVTKALELEEDNISNFNFSVDEKTTKNGPIVHTSYLTIITPVYLKQGLMMSILEDFKNSYPAYYSAKTPAEKKRIYTGLHAKYKDILDEGSSDNIEKQTDDSESPKPEVPADKNKKAQTTVKQPVKKPAVAAKKIVKPAPVKKEIPVAAAEKLPEEKEDKVTRNEDIDFLFHRLFTHVMHIRNKPFDLKREEQYMAVDDKWLFKLKTEMIQARKNELLSRENEITETISKNLTRMAEAMEKSRRLGSIAVLFNTDKIEKEHNQILSSIILPWIGPVPGFYFIGVIFLLMGIVFFFVLDYMVKNIKYLENWALGVADGNLSESIHIKSADEIGRLGDVFNHMLKEIIMKYHLEKFVSTSTRTMITKQGIDSSKIETGVTGRRNYSFIFSDVRGFTSFTEDNSPEKVMDVLNTYLNLQSNIVKANKGDIDDYVGDQIMAHFRGENRADLAIESSLLIMQEVSRLNSERDKEGLPIFEVGIGVHGGPVVTGNVGSHFRMDFTCLGDAVNLTSRLCSAAKAGEILVSAELFKKASKKYPHEVIDPIHVKGKKDAIHIIRLLPEKWNIS